MDKVIEDLVVAQRLARSLMQHELFNHSLDAQLQTIIDRIVSVESILESERSARKAEIPGLGIKKEEIDEETKKILEQFKDK